jgi:hypothetical protein
VVVPAHGSGSSSRSSSCRPPGPNRSAVGHGRPKANSVACTRFFSAVRCRTRCNRKRARSRSARTPGVGSQTAGTSSRRHSSASTHASIRSVLHASGANPLTFCASAICTCQPRSSSWSWTNRAPFIDQVAAITGCPNPATWRASPRSPSTSGGAAVTCTGWPASFIRCTSTRWRDRSNPAYNMATGPPLVLPDGDNRRLPPGEAPLHGIHSRAPAPWPGPARSHDLWWDGVAAGGPSDRSVRPAPGPAAGTVDGMTGEQTSWPDINPVAGSCVAPGTPR